MYDCSAFCDTQMTAMDLLNSHTAMLTPLPTSPQPDKQVQQPSASFKPPKLTIENWSVQTHDYYPWLSSILHGFKLAKSDDDGKLYHTLHAKYNNAKLFISEVYASFVLQCTVSGH